MRFIVRLVYPSNICADRNFRCFCVEVVCPQKAIHRGVTWRSGRQAWCNAGNQGRATIRVGEETNRSLPIGTWISATSPSFASDSARAQETIDPTQADRVYPETVRLREDMTINLKGTQRQPDGTITVGRWYQRYLPAGNTLIPPPSALNGSRPSPGYTHA